MTGIVNNYVSFISFVISLVFTTWFGRIIFQNIPIAILFLVLISLLVLINEQGFKRYRIAFIIFLTFFAYFQLTTTNVVENYKITDAQIAQQIKRLNSYPRNLTKLGYILESKQEVIYFYKVRENFFNLLDITQYFPENFSYLAIPFLLTGLYIFAKKHHRLLVVGGIFVILVFTVIGSLAKYGSFLLFPYLTFCIYLGLREVYDHINTAKK